MRLKKFEEIVRKMPHESWIFGGENRCFKFCANCNYLPYKVKC